jgi:predicted lipoprotein with Yx(FWY)xxD motif
MNLHRKALPHHVVAMSFLAAILAPATVFAQNPGPAAMKDGVLVGSNGMTLYTFDKDADGKSMCNGKCAENWPPLGADGGVTASGDFSVVTRDDGKKQYAYKGKPLYYFVKDQKPGDKTGEGVNNVWHVAK